MTAPGVPTVAPWPEADRLFHADPRWRGSDDAYSIPLGGDRILWLFGDSFIDPRGERRAGSTIVRNSVGIQVGADPCVAHMKFYWDDRGPMPGSFFPEVEGEALWPLDGAMLDGRLLLFFVRIRPRRDGAEALEVAGWSAHLVDNPEDEPPAWQIREVHTATSDQHLVQGPGSVVVRDEFLYGFGFIAGGALGVARWHASDAAAGRLDRPEVWTPDRGWLLEDDAAGAAPIMPGGATEFTVRWDARIQRWVQLQGVATTSLGWRTSERLEGPWTDLQPLHTPEEGLRSNRHLYAFKAHPELASADIVATYACNSFDLEVFNNESIYWPRFLRVTL